MDDNMSDIERARELVERAREMIRDGLDDCQLSRHVIFNGAGPQPTNLSPEDAILLSDTEAEEEMYRYLLTLLDAQETVESAAAVYWELTHGSQVDVTRVPEVVQAKREAGWRVRALGYVDDVESVEGDDSLPTMASLWGAAPGFPTPESAEPVGVVYEPKTMTISGQPKASNMKYPYPPPKLGELVFDSSPHVDWKVPSLPPGTRLYTRPPAAERDRRAMDRLRNGEVVMVNQIDGGLYEAYPRSYLSNPEAEHSTATDPADAILAAAEGGEGE